MIESNGPSTTDADRAGGRRRFLAAAATLASGAMLGAATPLSGSAAAAASTSSSSRHRVKVLRTPSIRFRDLVDYPFEPHYVDIDAGDDAHTRLRVHYVDEGPSDPAKASGETVLLLHGEPTWSYLYRHVIPPLVAAGHRCIAPDLIGFGKSDKLADSFAYTYQSHIDWLRRTLFDRLDLSALTMVCHDWGGGLGLRLLGEHPERFRRVVATNTELNTGDEDLTGAWEFLAQWLQHSQRTSPFPPSQVVQDFTLTELDPVLLAAYDAPFPDEAYLKGVRRFPLLIPLTPRDEATPALRRAWEVLETLEIPFLCAFSDQDHVTRGDHSALSGRIPGAMGQPHPTIKDAAHFVQEDKGAELAAVVNTFIGSVE